MPADENISQFGPELPQYPLQLLTKPQAQVFDAMKEIDRARPFRTPEEFLLHLRVEMEDPLFSERYIQAVRLLFQEVVHDLEQRKKSIKSPLSLSRNEKISNSGSSVSFQVNSSQRHLSGSSRLIASI
jgi:hypothetical protein